VLSNTRRPPGEAASIGISASFGPAPRLNRVEHLRARPGTKCPGDLIVVAAVREDRRLVQVKCEARRRAEHPDKVVLDHCGLAVFRAPGYRRRMPNLFAITDNGSGLAGGELRRSSASCR